MAVLTDDRKNALDALVGEAIAYRTGPELKALFDFQRKFPHMAPYNVMLLHMQNPGIAYALRSAEWRKRFGRKVKPAARPYVVLRTMGPVDFVFDLSDTEPLAPDDNRIPALAMNPFPTRGEANATQLRNLMLGCGKAGMQVEERDLGTELAGQVRHVADRMRDFHIVLNSKHTVTQRFGTLAHEMAHVLCGHLGPGPQGYWPDRARLQLSEGVKEFEAEMVAYLFTARQGIGIGSADYLSGYLDGTGEVPNFSLDAVLKADGVLESMADGRYRPSKKKS